MSYREKIAWWSLAAMLLSYGPYFLLLRLDVLQPTTVPDLNQLAAFAVAASVHACLTLLGYWWSYRQSPVEAKAPLDERDERIEHRARKAAYGVLLLGIIVVGCILPFTQQGWSIVNAALFCIIFAEIVHYASVSLQYWRQTA